MKPKIIITSEGGIIQSVISNCPVEYMIIDVDDDDFGVDELVDFGDGPVYAGTADADVDPETVTKLFIQYNELNK